MCGILGLFSPSGAQPPFETFASALDRLKLRGPDDSGTWREDAMVLGHRRLAIVDLSAAGHQPMESSDRRYVIVFNGEIYNHAELRPRLRPQGEWRSASDTETLIEAYRAWGVRCLDRINGMFAFAIWDRTERTLFVARDRVGVKPLYYSDKNGQFAFGSRPGALSMLLADGALVIDPEALRVYLEIGYIPAPLSFHRDIRKLPAAHYLLVNARGVRRVRYWDYRSIKPDLAMNSRPEAELIEELDALIRSAVKSRLMSDVPLGAFLSGGVDSALVVAAMKATGVEHPKTFTIAFKERAFNEGPAAAKTAEYLGVDHVHETLDVNSLLDLLPTYIQEYDEPFADSSAFPTMAVTRLGRRHVTVALTGDGADELFGGYHYYPLIDRLAPLLTWRPRNKRIAQRLLASLPWHRTKLLAGALQSRDTVALFHFLRSVSKDYPSLLNDDILKSTTGSETWFAQFGAAFPVDISAAETAMRLDSGLTLPDLFLQKVDVATMAFSLEARCPMTDYRLVEWAMRLPVQLKIRQGESKYLLKKVLSKYLPAEAVYRPKMGFGVPLAQWLRGPLRTWAEELLHDDSLMSRVPLDRQRVRQLHRQQLAGERESHPLLWSALMLLCFVQTHEVRRALPVMAYREVA
ncbi:MAG: asparagine synthase (glutamine-hydrolyzing) [Steroidobacteraceae bacterium]